MAVTAASHTQYLSQLPNYARRSIWRTLSEDRLCIAGGQGSYFALEINLLEIPWTTARHYFAVSTSPLWEML